MKKVTNPSLKKRRIAVAHIKGKSNNEIAKVEYPTAKHGAKIVSRELNAPDTQMFLEQTKFQALKEHNITWSRIIRPISDALDFDGENEAQAANIRLKASKQAQELLQAKSQEQVNNNLPPIQLPKNLTSIELQRLIWSKQDDRT